MILKDIIFSRFFSKWDKKRDTYKDATGRGILQRYNELLAEEYDQYSSEALDKLIENTSVPSTLLPKFINYLEKQIGSPYINSDLVLKRKLLRYLQKVYDIKGTKTSYELMYRLMGFDVDFYLNAGDALQRSNLYYVVPNSTFTGTAQITDGTTTYNLKAGQRFYCRNATSSLVSVGGGAKLKREIILDFFDGSYTFDYSFAGNQVGLFLGEGDGQPDGNGFGIPLNLSDVGFDDPQRTFDSSCSSCSTYVVRLYGTLPLNLELYSSIFRVVSFLEPVNAELFNFIYYNDEPLMLDAIQVYIDENGDLNYDNSANPNITLGLTDEGDLTKAGDFKNQLFLDSEGDLNFIPDYGN